MDHPRISVVIPSYNQGKYIERTILSVVGQGYPNLEIIVVDGGSTDETVEVIKRYEKHLAYWVSEKDSGQGNAINKGFRRATGDILGWLNSDDQYLPGALLDVVREMGSVDEPKALYGGTVHIYEGSTRALSDLPHVFPRGRLSVNDLIVQPSTFWTRALWEKTGEIDESYHYVMDWDWFARAERVGRFVPCRKLFALYLHHEGHKTGDGGKKRAEEVVRFIAKYNDASWVAAYRDVVDAYDTLYPRYALMHRYRLHRVRHLFAAPLYLKHGMEKVDVAMGMLFAV